ncbi:MAG TPA: AraC family transcriptional regulator [Pyrinomonadaceae bacterium]|nr:AraC family transcriptional regulator [Pyrinomonadaceae bacterium]
MKRPLDFSYGTLLKTSVVAGLTLTETAYSPNLQLPRHSHQSTYFCLVLQGSFTELYERGSRPCSPATLIFHPAGERHSDLFHTPARCFNLFMSLHWLERVRQHSTVEYGPADFGSGLFTHLAMKIYREFRQTDEVSPLIVEGLMLEILGEAARPPIKHLRGTRPHWLVQACRMLRDRFCENLSLSEIAGAVGVHKTHLAREFRRYYFCTVGEYVRRLRIEFACRQLSTSDATLVEVAHAAGFFDQSHFGRTFKQHTGMSPTQYRQTFRTNRMLKR